MISKEQVQRIAKLARINLSGNEVIKFQKELSAILDYFEILKKADVLEAEPTFQSTESFIGKERMRKDEKKPASSESINSIIKQIPEKKGRYVRVKAVF